MLVTIALLI